MYNTLQIEHALYSIDENVLQDFKKLAKQISVYEEIEEQLAYNSLDNWSVVFQIWCLLHEENRELYLNYQKMMVYSCNFYCLQLLRNDVTIQGFLKKWRGHEEEIIFFAYYLAVEMLDWVHGLLEKYKDGRVLMEKNMNRAYFLLFTEQGIEYDETHELYAEQKLVTSILAQSYSMDDAFERHVKKALESTESKLLKI